MRYHRPLLLVLVLVSGALLAARPVLGATQEATPASAAALPDTPVGRQLEWVIGQLNGDAQSLTEADITSRFTPDFLALVPPAQAIAGTRQFAAMYAPFRFEGAARPPTEHQAIGLIEGGSGAVFAVAIVVEREAPHRIADLEIEPAPQPTPAPPAEPGPYAGLYDVGGRSLYLHCTGEGSPTVVLESGYNTPTTTWLGLQGALSPLTRVCSYDRANVPGGASDPAPTPRTAQNVVDDLHALLRTAGVPGPYVVVGHSIGGILTRLYAGQYPDEVAGMVLIDASHEEQDERTRALVTPEQWAAMEQMNAGFPDAEGLDLDGSLAQMREARVATPLRPMPLVVVTAGLPPDPSFAPPGWPVAAEHALHLELQDDLVRLVPNARHVVAEQSGHFVQLDQPELVIEAVRDVVAAVRSPGTWATPPAG